MKEAYTMLLERGLAKRQDELDYAENAVRQFSDGHVWLVGGSVYRTIVNELYGTPLPEGTDFDFVMQRLNPDAERDLRSVKLPHDVELKSAGDLREYGKTKLIVRGMPCDLWSLQELRFWMPGKQGTIEDYLSDVPLTVQSIAYDLDTHELIGDIGIKAITERNVGVLRYPVAEHYARRRKKNVEQLVSDMIYSLGFDLPAA